MEDNIKQELHEIKLTLTTEECTILYSAVLNMYEKYYRNHKQIEDETAKEYWLNLAIRTWMIFNEIVHQTKTKEV